jgi:hypothetical protein
MPMAGIDLDRVLILIARRKLFSMITLKYTHVYLSTYFEYNVTFTIKVRGRLHKTLNHFFNHYFVVNK